MTSSPSVTRKKANLGHMFRVRLTAEGPIAGGRFHFLCVYCMIAFHLFAT